MLLLLFSKTVRRILAALVLLPIVVFGATAARVWWVARQDDRPRSDAIVVLGASQFDGRPSAVFRWIRFVSSMSGFAASIANRSPGTSPAW